VNDLIALRDHTLTFDELETGTAFTFYITANNILGAAASPSFTFTLAAVPDQPSTVPLVNL
jgi:hypothetical protein